MRLTSHRVPESLVNQSATAYRPCGEWRLPFSKFVLENIELENSKIILWCALLRSAASCAMCHIWWDICWDGWNVWRRSDGVFSHRVLSFRICRRGWLWILIIESRQSVYPTQSVHPEMIKLIVARSSTPTLTSLNVFLLLLCYAFVSHKKTFFRPSQPGSCAWLSPFLLCADHTCVLACVYLCMCVWQCVIKVINMNKYKQTRVCCFVSLNW